MPFGEHLGLPVVKCQGIIPRLFYVNHSFVASRASLLQEINKPIRASGVELKIATYGTFGAGIL
jgi:hypothetical protein